jgi:hypothetical protein
VAVVAADSIRLAVHRRRPASARRRPRPAVRRSVLWAR